MLNNILENIYQNNFNPEIINESGNIWIYESGVYFNIAMIESYSIFSEYKDIIKSYYNISTDVNIYILSINIEKENYNETFYESFYFNNGKNYLIDLEICNNTNINNFLSNCSLYSIESLINDECISCKKGYYPIYNSKPGKCFKSVKGYYLDEKNLIFRQCYNTCLSCEIKGNEINHNCTICKEEYQCEIQNNTNDYKNCYDSCPYSDVNSNFVTNDTYNITFTNNPSYSYQVTISDTSENSHYNDEVFESEIINDKLIINCSLNKTYEFNNTCYNECPNGTKSNELNPFYCEIICSKENPYENIKTKECISNCTVNEIYKDICKINYEDKNFKLSTKIIDEIMNGQLDELIEEIIHNKTEIIIKEDYAIHQITSISNQLNNNNLSFIDFKGCEDILKQEYNIKAEEELLIYKIENIVKGFNIPIIEYILFTQNDHIKLNLSICNNITVEYNIPVSINENEIYKYDPSSQFYNDKCNKYSKDGNVDITLFDRKNEYNNNNMSLCESSCTYKGYNSTNSKAICDCNIKTDMTYSDDDTNDLLNKIQNEKSSSNLDVTKCINDAYSSEEIKSNSGFITLLIIIIIFIIIFIIFCIKGRNMLETKIDEVIIKIRINKKKKLLIK